MTSPFDPMILFSDETVKPNENVNHDLLLSSIARLECITREIERQIIYNQTIGDRLANYFQNTIEQIYFDGEELFNTEILKKAWHIYVSQIQRLLIERFIYVEAKCADSFDISTHWELLRAEEYREQGYFSFHFEEGDLTLLKNLFATEIEILRARLADGLSNREDMSINTIPAEKVQAIGALFAKAGALRALSAGGQCQVDGVSGLAIELSVPRASWWYDRRLEAAMTPPKTTYFHRDEGIWAPKAIVYLDDVDEFGGPFEIVPASFRAESHRISGAASRVRFYPERHMKNYGESDRALDYEHSFFGRLPQYLRTNSHYGYLIPDNTMVSEQIMNNRMIFTESAGFAIIFDGYSLLHRGGLVQKKARLALQVILPVRRLEKSVVLSSFQSGIRIDG